MFSSQNKAGLQHGSLKKSSKDLRGTAIKKGNSTQQLRDTKLKVKQVEIKVGPLTKKSEHSLSAKDVRRTSKR